MHREDYILDQTCDACPEQYDVYLDGREIGYLRLRHGNFTADYTADGGYEPVLRAHPEGDGIFEYDERNFYLNAAVAAIDARHHGDAEKPATNTKNVPAVGWTVKEEQ